MDITESILNIVTLILFGISAVSLVRVVAGPSFEDRMIGLNLVLSQVSAILVLLAVKYKRAIYLDVALVYAILGFIGTLAIARYFGKKGD